MQVGVPEAVHFLSAFKSVASTRYVLKLIAGGLWDQIRTGRTLRLNGDNALVAALAAACFENGVEMWLSAPAWGLIHEGGQVLGTVVEQPAGPMEIRAARGVILSTGGFPHDSALRAELYPDGVRKPELWGAYPFGNSDDGIRMGRDAGEEFDRDMAFPVAFVPTGRYADS